MSNFYIEKIELEGFLKYKDKITKSFQRDLNVITGPNASGKTSLLEAIIFALFGISRVETSKDLTQKDLINKDSDTANITLYFTYNNKNYKLKRVLKKKSSRAFRDFYLFENGRLTNYRKKDMFSFFKLSSTIIKRIIYSPQQELTAILTLEKSHREKFFKEILNLDTVDFVLETLKKQKNKSAQILEHLLKEDVSNENLEALKLELEALKKEKESLLKKIENLKKIILIFQNNLGKLEELKKSLFVVKNISNLEREINQLVNYFKEKYNISFQNLEDFIFELENKLEDLNREYTNLAKLLNEIKSKILRLEKIYLALKNIKPNLKKEFENLEKEYFFIKDSVYKSYLSYKKDLSDLKNTSILKINFLKDVTNLKTLEEKYLSLKENFEKKLTYLEFIEKNLNLKFSKLTKLISLLKSFSRDILDTFEKEKERYLKFKELALQIDYIQKEIKKLSSEVNLENIKKFLKEINEKYNLDLSLDDIDKLLENLNEISKNPILILKEAKKSIYSDPKKAEKLIDNAILSLEYKDKIDNLKLDLINYKRLLEKKKELGELLNKLEIPNFETFERVKKEKEKKYLNLEKEYNNQLQIYHQLKADPLFSKLIALGKKDKEILNCLLTLKRIYQTSLNNIKVLYKNLKKDLNNLKLEYEFLKQKFIKEDFKNKFGYDFDSFETIYKDLEKKYKVKKREFEDYKASIIFTLNTSKLVSYENAEKDPNKYVNKISKVLDILKKLEANYQKRKKDYEDFLKDREKASYLAHLSLNLKSEKETFKKALKTYEENIKNYLINLIESKILDRIKNLNPQIFQKYKELSKNLDEEDIVKDYETFEKIINLILNFLNSLLKLREEDLNKIQLEIGSKQEKYKFIENRIKTLEKERKKLKIISNWTQDLINYKTAIKEDFLKNIPYLVSLYYSEIGFNYEVEITPDFNILIKDGNVTRNVKSLSGGEKVALALALKLALAKFLKVPFLILDEPFEALDEDRLANAKSLLERYFKNQIFVATHTW